MSARSEKLRLKLLAKATKKSKYAATCGEIVFQHLFDGQTIRLYSGGYISIGGIFKEPQPEKLIAINFDVSTSKKTGLGRFVGAALTDGSSLLGTGNIRGDVYIAIQTEESNSVVHSSSPTTDDVAEIRRLELLTQQILISKSVINPTTERTIAEEVEKLGILRDRELLTEEEFVEAKAKLLGL
mgnify:CR=1 FL=1